ncbi:2Fe-2S iron-sulfur cluster-binding protein [Aurantivibrio infirmus]
MVKVTFVEHSGGEQVVEVEPGQTLMNAAIDNLVPGIDADCGGACSCATCHVYIDQDWVEKLGKPNATEESMLGLSTDRRENSRLSCQIKITEDLDGLVVTTPEFQF